MLKELEIADIIIDKLANASHIVVLTGAGVSAESGVKTFRDPDGIWAKFNPQELASIDGFMSNPKLVWDWYQERRAIVDSVLPNTGHLALAELERIVPKFSIYTQNVDKLHQRAGSQNVQELHGNIIENKCFDCNEPYFDNIEKDTLPKCKKCGGRIRPNVVWFGEMLPEQVLRNAERDASHCDFFITIGTSGEVYPAAGLPELAVRNGAFALEINANKTNISRLHQANIFAPSGLALPVIVELLKNKTR